MVIRLMSGNIVLCSERLYKGVQPWQIHSIVIKHGGFFPFTMTAAWEIKTRRNKGGITTMLWKQFWLCHNSWLLKRSHLYKPGEKNLKNPAWGGRRSHHRELWCLCTGERLWKGQQRCGTDKSSVKCQWEVWAWSRICVRRHHAGCEQAPRSECVTPSLLPFKHDSVSLAQGSPAHGKYAMGGKYNTKTILCSHPRRWWRTESQHCRWSAE